eukprot:1150779-Pelagomonas_calceolata.AAC.4
MVEPLPGSNALGDIPLSFHTLLPLLKGMNKGGGRIVLGYCRALKHSATVHWDKKEKKKRKTA